MDKFVFLLHGNKKDRVYTSDGYKVYFPDRHNRNDLSVGIAECSISKDLDKYGFITGGMISPDRVGTLRDALNADKVNLNNVVSLGVIEGYEYWIEDVDDIRLYCAFIDNDVFTFKSESDFTLSSKQYSNISNFYFNLRHQSSYVDLSEIRNEYSFNILKNLGEVDRQTMIEGIIRSLGIRFPQSITLYGSKLVKIDSCIYYYNHKSCNLDIIHSYNNVEGLTVEDLTDEIKNIILNYNLFIGSGTGLCYKTFRCFNESIEVCFMPTRDFSFSSYETFKTEIEESKKELEAFKKRVGKCVTANSVSELQKLSTKKWQLGERF